jgi:transcriptional regulator with XRE-family HTH domain
MTPADLREYRLSRRVSQPELAELLDVRTNTVWRWEHGEARIPGFLHLALAHLDLLQGWAVRRQLGAALHQGPRRHHAPPGLANPERAESRPSVILRHPKEVGQ